MNIASCIKIDVNALQEGARISNTVTFIRENVGIIRVEEIRRFVLRKQEAVSHFRLQSRDTAQREVRPVSYCLFKYHPPSD